MEEDEERGSSIESFDEDEEGGINSNSVSEEEEENEEKRRRRFSTSDEEEEEKRNPNTKRSNPTESATYQTQSFTTFCRWSQRKMLLGLFFCRRDGDIYGPLFPTSSSVAQMIAIVGAMNILFGWDPSPLECQDMVRELLKKVNHAKQLTLGPACVKVLSLLELKGLPSPLSNQNRKCLTVTTGFVKLDLLGVASLLSSFPYLEKLVIMVEYSKEDKWIDRDDRRNLFGTEQENFWAAKEGSFECLLGCLKTVEIVGIKPMRWRSSSMDDEFAGLFEFAKFILRSARVLERMLLVPKEFSKEEMLHLYDVAQKLLKFPRSSPHAIVLLPDVDLCFLYNFFG
ncbi:F-box/LRR-repeat protein [Corchorus capsularis]|uniref:F-box/LRR-repeat protein n=1 Tax=Corchorus capsularis TaxID=210143 RepID=A0A1R3GWV3_COCAP|nr:F-box/LRR-repeat protein [Corchorus capsularis]